MIPIKDTKEWYSEKRSIGISEFDEYDMHVCKVANEYANSTLVQGIINSMTANEFKSMQLKSPLAVVSKTEEVMKALLKMAKKIIHHH